MDEAPSQQQSHSAKNDTNPMSQVEMKITKPVLVNLIFYFLINKNVF